MYNLIIAVVSMGLMAAAALVGINYIPSQAYERQRVQTSSISGMEKLNAAVSRYLDANRDAEGFVIFPGEGVDLMPVVTPAFGFKPADVGNAFTWNITSGYFNGMEAIGVCMRPLRILNQDELATLGRVQARLPVEAAVLASNCNASGSTINGTHLTYWVVLNHLEGIVALGEEPAMKVATVRPLALAYWAQPAGTGDNPPENTPDPGDSGSAPFALNLLGASISHIAKLSGSSVIKMEIQPAVPSFTNRSDVVDYGGYMA